MINADLTEYFHTLILIFITKYFILSEQNTFFSNELEVLNYFICYYYVLSRKRK